MSLAEIETRSPKPRHRISFVDCDIHPVMRSFRDYLPYLSQRWQEHLLTYGSRAREPLSDTIAYPRMAPAISRTDAWPPGGGSPGSDLEFMQRQHLDAYDVERGILIPLLSRAASERNVDFGAALATAANDWQVAEWLDRDARLRGSVVVAHEDPQAAAAEIDRRAADRRFVQVLIPPRSLTPLGNRRYWPIFDAATRNGLPITFHIGGTSGYAPTSCGWPSYYFEEHHSNVQSIEALILSMIAEGGFERFPQLRVVLVESGFAWVPSFCWRLDNAWRKLKSEVPHLTRAPSEYVREHFYYTTQPIDEPERPAWLATMIDWVGVDRIMFATDYPHWDFDDPRYIFKTPIPEDVKRRIYSENARSVFRLD